VISTSRRRIDGWLEHLRGGPDLAGNCSRERSVVALAVGFFHAALVHGIAASTWGQMYRYQGVQVHLSDSVEDEGDDVGTNNIGLTESGWPRNVTPPSPGQPSVVARPTKPGMSRIAENFEQRLIDEFASKLFVPCDRPLHLQLHSRSWSHYGQPTSRTVLAGPRAWALLENEVGRSVVETPGRCQSVRKLVWSIPCISFGRTSSKRQRMARSRLFGLLMGAYASE